MRGKGVKEQKESVNPCMYVYACVFMRKTIIWRSTYVSFCDRIKYSVCREKSYVLLSIQCLVDICNKKKGRRHWCNERLSRGQVKSISNRENIGYWNICRGKNNTKKKQRIAWSLLFNTIERYQEKRCTQFLQLYDYVQTFFEWNLISSKKIHNTYIVFFFLFSL